MLVGTAFFGAGSALGQAASAGQSGRSPAAAQPTGASADPSLTPPPLPSAAPSAAPAPAAASGTCIERLPEGKARPKFTESIAPRGVSGHAQRLRIVVEHGPGETVLPSGFQALGGDELKALESSHFFIPDPKGSAAPHIERKQVNGGAETTVDLWLLPLPPKPGRQRLELPPLPIAISRASGEVMTLCTSPHTLTIEDPIANESQPKPRKNPAWREQIEEWTTAKYVTLAAAASLVVGALLALLWTLWQRRPRPLPPPPPRRPAYETAMEALYDLRHSGLLREQRFAEFYDRAADIVRRYLGERYGYDGLESTTREALQALRRVALPMDVWVKIQEFMQDADLVKFAKQAPTEAECQSVLERCEQLIETTRPAEFTAPPPVEPAENTEGAAP